MEVQVQQYENMKINGDSDWNSIGCRICKAGEKSGIGGVDHFMKKSIKVLVLYYVARIKREYKIEGGARYDWGMSIAMAVPGDKMVVTVDLHNKKTDETKIINVELICSA